MSAPIDAYRAGYDKGRADDAGGLLSEMTMGMLRDDPGGHFAAGYHDGAAGTKFNPPSDEARKPAAELNPFDDKVAIKAVCPNCGALDWFEWKFLGKLKDPVCGHTWYVSSGTYALMQIRAAFGAGKRFAKYMTSGISGEGAWIAKALGWFTGTILGIGMRLEFGILMIPIQALAALSQPKSANSDIRPRVTVLTVSLVIVGIGGYAIYRSSGPASQPSQPNVFVQGPAPSQSNNRPSAPTSYQPIARPSFDCAKAHTNVELLVCRDTHLANLDNEMVSAYRQALDRLQQDAKPALHRDHLSWFRNYGKTCSQSVNDVDRAACIENFLSAHTTELRNRAQ